MSVEDKLICTRGLECLLNGIRDNMGSSGGTQSGGLTFEKEPDGLWHAKDETGDLGAIGVIPSDRFVITEHTDTYDLIYDPLGIWKRSDKTPIPRETNNWEVDFDVAKTLTTPYATEFGFIPDFDFDDFLDEIWVTSNVTAYSTETGKRVKLGYRQNGSHPFVGSSITAPERTHYMYGGGTGADTGNGSNGIITPSILHNPTEYRKNRIYSSLKAGTKCSYIFSFKRYEETSKYTDYEGTVVFTFPMLKSVK